MCSLKYFRHQNRKYLLSATQMEKFAVEWQWERIAINHYPSVMVRLKDSVDLHVASAVFLILSVFHSLEKK